MILDLYEQLQSKLSSINNVEILKPSYDDQSLEIEIELPADDVFEEIYKCGLVYNDNYSINNYLEDLYNGLSDVEATNTRELGDDVSEYMKFNNTSFLSDKTADYSEMNPVNEEFLKNVAEQIRLGGF